MNSERGEPQSVHQPLRIPLAVREMDHVGLEGRNLRGARGGEAQLGALQFRQDPVVALVGDEERRPRRQRGAEPGHSACPAVRERLPCPRHQQRAPYDTRPPQLRSADRDAGRGRFEEPHPGAEDVIERAQSPDPARVDGPALAGVLKIGGPILRFLVRLLGDAVVLVIVAKDRDHASNTRDEKGGPAAAASGQEIRRAGKIEGAQEELARDLWRLRGGPGAHAGLGTLEPAAGSGVSRRVQSHRVASSPLRAQIERGESGDLGRAAKDHPRFRGRGQHHHPGGGASPGFLLRRCGRRQE